MSLGPVLNQVAQRFRQLSEQKGLYLRVGDNRGWRRRAAKWSPTARRSSAFVANLTDNA